MHGADTNVEVKINIVTAGAHAFCLRCPLLGNSGGENDRLRYPIPFM